MAPLIDSYFSRKLYSEIFDFNSDKIPDRLTITKEKGIIQATVEMNGYCDSSAQNKIVLFQQNRCNSESLKENRFSNFCPHRLLDEYPNYSTKNQTDLSSSLSNIFQGASCFLQLDCPKVEVELVSPLLQCMPEEDRLEEINRSDLEKLPSSFDYKNSFEIVRQRGATIIDPQKNPQIALYTFFPPLVSF